MGLNIALGVRPPIEISFLSPKMVTKGTYTNKLVLSRYDPKVIIKNTTNNERLGPRILHVVNHADFKHYNPDKFKHIEFCNSRLESFISIENQKSNYIDTSLVVVID